MNDDYEYTQDWFNWAPPLLFAIKEGLTEHKAVLEIGSFEGRSTVWFIENFLDDGGTIHCVDTWEGGAEHVNGEMEGSKGRFDRNMDRATRKRPSVAVEELHMTSDGALAAMLFGEIGLGRGSYDLVYVDGSHLARDVLTDACMAWPLLKTGGFMVFDDYLWGDAGNLLDRPKLAVDAFSSIFAKELDIVYIGYQYAVQKK